MSSKITGDLGESAAQQYLTEKGYQILATNFKRKWGELDIVANKKPFGPAQGKPFGSAQGKLIFVEVKSIHQKYAFWPEDEINPKKKRQLIKMAQIFMSENRIPLDAPYQIDIVAVEFNWENQIQQIRHLENAIEDTA